MSAPARPDVATSPDGDPRARRPWRTGSANGQAARGRTLRRLLTRAAAPDPPVDLLVGASTTVRLPRSHAVRSALGLTSFVGLLSVEGTLLEANDTTATRPELSACDALGLPFWDAAWWSWSPVVQGRLRAALARAVAGATVRNDETALVRRNQLITVDLAWAPLVRAGAVTAVVCSAIDLSPPRSAHVTAETGSSGPGWTMVNRSMST